MATFQIFESDNKTFHLNIENILLLCLFPLGFLNSFDNYFKFFAKYGLIIIIIVGLLLMIANMARVKPLYGKLNGQLIFNSDSIEIRETVYYLNDISKIHLRVTDYEGKEYGRIRPSYYPRLSNGTNNILRLELKNSEKINVYFKVNLEYDNEQLRPLVLELIRHNLLSINESQKILRLYNEYEIKKLQNEVNKKELN